MSTELDRALERLYAGLGDEAQFAPLAPAEDLRRRGNRQTARKAVLAGAVALVLVAGATAGGSMLLAGDDVRIEPAPQPPTRVTAAPVPPSPSSTRGTTTSPSTTPASPTESPSGTAAEGERPRPTAVPDAVFLTAAELNTTAALGRPADRYLPSLCRRAPIDNGVALRRTLSGYVNEPGQPVDAVPGAQLTQSIAVYEQPGDARSFLESLGGAPSSCPTEPIASGTIRYRSRSSEAAGVGTDAVLIEQQVPATDFVTGEPVPGTWTFYTAAVRHGDVVVVLYTFAYENWGLDEDPAFMVDLLQRAYDKVAGWRGPVAEKPGP